ncbi:HTH iclR-type domain-containing protein [Trichonephila clavipes]|nr:HTH iclR-type domain-containing protein [Trichonephila clavipes]
MPGCRQRRHFLQTDDFTKGMVIGLRREGWSFRQIAADTNRDVSMVHRLWRRWLAQGNVARSRGPGATRVTSASEDRRIRRKRWQPRQPRLPPFFSMCKTPWMFQYRPEPFPVDWLKVACTHVVRSEH